MWKRKTQIGRKTRKDTLKGSRIEEKEIKKGTGQNFKTIKKYSLSCPNYAHQWSNP
jgi:hypothetical protein